MFPRPRESIHSADSTNPEAHTSASTASFAAVTASVHAARVARVALDLDLDLDVDVDMARRASMAFDKVSGATEELT